MYITILRIRYNGTVYCTLLYFGGSALHGAPEKILYLLGLGYDCLLFNCDMIWNLGGFYLINTDSPLKL